MRFFSRSASNFDRNNDDGEVIENYDDDRGRSSFIVRHRGVAIGASVILLALIAIGCWVAIGAYQAKSNLEQARSAAQQAKDALLKADTKTAAAAADEAVSHAQSARDDTHSIAWDIAAALPWLGSPFETGRQITDVVLGLASNVLRPAASIGVTISPERLYKDGRVDVQLLRSQAPQLTELSTEAKQIDQQAGAITDPRYVSIMSDARSELQSQITGIASLLDNTAIAARLLPSMMGADGPRTYFVGFQTNAEARGTGGLLGGFGILEFADGKPSVDTLAANTELDKQFAPIDLGDDFIQQYGYANPTTDYRNSNLSPHFPYAAQIWKSLWAQQTGMNVDGAIAIDPVALSYILGAVGSITMPDGEVITRDNVVQLTESTAYLRFPNDQVARKQYLQGIANAVVKKITGRVQSSRQLLDALGKALNERRIAVWSSVPEEQKLLEQTPLAHVIPETSEPFAAVVVNNLGGNKLDYYLKPEIEYAADECKGDTRASTVTVKLTNTVPNEPLPDYVAAAAGLDLPIQFPRATNIASVRLFATKGATLSSVILNGQRVPAIVGQERGHPVFEVQVLIPPGQAADVSYQLSEPNAPGSPQAPSQPLVQTVIPKIKVPSCSG